MEKQLVKINLGSGQRRFAGDFVNVDVNPRWRPDVLCDGVELAKHFAPASASMIVLHHCLEHFELTKADEVIKACHEVLAPGGLLIICVPDLEALTRRWLEGKIDDYIFCVNLHGAWMGDEADLHRWSYTRKTLKDKLKAAAFWSHIMDFDWRAIHGGDLARDWWVLAVEAIK